LLCLCFALILLTCWLAAGSTAAAVPRTLQSSSTLFPPHHCTANARNCFGRQSQHGSSSQQSSAQRTLASTYPSWFLSMSLNDLRLKSCAFRICSQVLPEPALSPSCNGEHAEGADKEVGVVGILQDLQRVADKTSSHQKKRALLRFDLLQA
jgi:hypothetical protein